MGISCGQKKALSMNWHISCSQHETFNQKDRCIMNFYKDKYKYIIWAFLAFVVNASSVYADITINGSKTVKTNSTTVFKVDDTTVTESEFATKSNGQVATVSAKDSDNGADSVSTENHVKGPVTSLDPFQVFGQDIVINADTVLVDNNGTFALGDLLEVSGYFDSSNVFLATRVEKSNSLNKWKIFGYLEQVNGNLVTIGQLTFDTTNMTLTNCNAPLTQGDLVKIKLTPIMNFDPANAIDTVSEFKCKNGLVDVPDDQDGDFEFEVEGFVSEVIDANNFIMNNQQVAITANTVFRNGTAADIVVDIKLEVEGALDSTTNILTADKIKFKNTKIKMTGPVATADLNADQVTIFGISAIFNAFTEDKDGLIANGMTMDSNIKIEGYVDSAGNVFVEEIKSKGAFDSSNVRLRGPADNMATDSLTILGVNVDTTNALFFMEEQSIDAATFFASVATGSIVDINHGAYDAATNTISGGEITLENVNEDSNSSVTGKASNGNGIQVAGTASVNYGTVTAFQPAQKATTPPPANTGSTGGGGSTDMLLLTLISLLIVSRKINR